MKTSKYPRLGERRVRPRNTTARCVVCDKLGTAKQDIELDIFRGHDEVVWTCDTKHSAEKFLEALWIANISIAFEAATQRLKGKL